MLLPPLAPGNGRSARGGGILKETFTCFPISTHIYVHFLPAMRATHPFQRAFSSPSAVTYTTMELLLACRGSGRRQGDEQAVRALAKAVNINSELG